MSDIEFDAWGRGTNAPTIKRTYEELHATAIPTMDELRGMAAHNPKEVAATRDGKPPLDLLEHSADIETAWALLSGAKKYGKKNYRTIPVYASTYAAAVKRHIGAYLNGQELDPETGLSHLAHAVANVHVMFGAMEAGTFIDDLGPQPRTEEQEAMSKASNKQHSAQ